MPFKFEEQKIKDVVLIKPDVYFDNRGFFMESYKKSIFKNHGIMQDFCQDNFSSSTKGVLRGLHYQIKPYEQAKLVRCIKGKIIDVALDIRQNSPHFGEYVKVELSETNKHILYIPEGFAHGFVVLSENADVYYKSSNEYAPNCERGIIWSEIDWDIDFEPILSEKDLIYPKLEQINKEELI